jgi:hypothetical protein
MQNTCLHHMVCIEMRLLSRTYQHRIERCSYSALLMVEHIPHRRVCIETRLLSRTYQHRIERCSYSVLLMVEQIPHRTVCMKRRPLSRTYQHRIERCSCSVLQRAGNIQRYTVCIASFGHQQCLYTFQPHKSHRTTCLHLPVHLHCSNCSTTQHSPQKPCLCHS